MMTSTKELEGKYEILRKLHEGGMGSIYLVRHNLLDELRIIKVMKRHLAGDPHFRDRFLREARAAASLKHPNIAGIHDFTADEMGNGFIVMEYIYGVSLEQLLAAPNLVELPLVLEIARQSLRALDFLHRNGYVHRDISPDNIMLGKDVDDRASIKLIDLGIIKKIDSRDGLTTTGHFLGKLRYSSPEHFGELGAAGAGKSSDVYSFGLVLYELLTGEEAVRGSDLQSYCAGHVQRPPRPFEETDPKRRIPDDLRGYVLRSLAKRTEDRFQDAAVFAEALATVQERLPPHQTNIRELIEIRKDEESENGSAGSTQNRIRQQFTVRTRSKEPRISNQVLFGNSSEPPAGAVDRASSHESEVPRFRDGEGWEPWEPRESRRLVTVNPESSEGKTIIIPSGMLHRKSRSRVSSSESPGMDSAARTVDVGSTPELVPDPAADPESSSGSGTVLMEQTDPGSPVPGGKEAASAPSSSENRYLNPSPLETLFEERLVEKPPPTGPEASEPSVMDLPMASSPDAEGIVTSSPAPVTSTNVAESEQPLEMAGVETPSIEESEPSEEITPAQTPPTSMTIEEQAELDTSKAEQEHPVLSTIGPSPPEPILRAGRSKQEVGPEPPSPGLAEAGGEVKRAESSKDLEPIPEAGIPPRVKSPKKDDSSWFTEEPDDTEGVASDRWAQQVPPTGFWHRSQLWLAENRTLFIWLITSAAFVGLVIFLVAGAIGIA